MGCSFDRENVFGPAVSTCRRSFDFTLLFEDIFLRFVPSCIFIVAAGLRIAILVRQPTKVKLGPLYTFKLIAALGLVALELTSLISGCLKHGVTTSFTTPATAANLSASLILLMLSFLEHVRSTRPSFLISAYLSIISLLRSAVARTYWLMNHGGLEARTVLASVIVLLILNVIECMSKKRWLLDAYQAIYLEENAGFFGRSFLLWLWRLFYVGYRRQLEAPDIRITHPSLKASPLVTKFARLKDITQTEGEVPQIESHSSLMADFRNEDGRYDLLLLTWQCSGLDSVLPIFPRLCLAGFTYAQPLMAISLLNFINDKEMANIYNGYGLVGATFLIYLGIAVSTSWYWQLAYKAALKTRGGLLTAISQKMFRLQADENGLESKVLTLAISDSQRIQSATSYAHELWAVPLETALGLWLLWRQVGPPSMAAFGLAFVCLLVSTWMSKQIGTQQGVWLAATEKRIAATQTMLNGLKGIKMMGMERIIGDRIESLRKSELLGAKLFRKLLVASIASSYITICVAPVVVLGAYVGSSAVHDHSIDSSRLFGSLILVSLVASPLSRLLQVIPMYGAAIECYSRIQRFLRQPEIAFSRKHLEDTPPYCLESENIDDGVEKSPYSDTLKLLSVVRIRSADFGWEAHQPCLKEVNLDIEKGQHIAITGPVGCGKSLLVKAILGEVAPQRGDVFIKEVAIGYSSQVPWLENLTARENALRLNEGDEAWQDLVIESCALHDILEKQVFGLTIGSRGISLSGGEKQRLSLARAVACRPGILILDDVFSSMDAETKKFILSHLFGGHGILKDQETTIIQISHDSKSDLLEHRTYANLRLENVLRYADKVYVIDESGSLKLMRSSISGLASMSSGELIKPKRMVTQAKGAEDAAKSPKSQTLPNIANALLINDRSVYHTYFQSIGVFHTLTFIACGVSYTVSFKFPEIWAQWWAKASSVGDTRRTPGEWIGVYAMLGVLPIVMLGIWGSHLMLKMVPKTGVAFHHRLIGTVLNAKLSFIGGIDSGSIINRFNQDLMLIDSRLPTDFLNTVSEFLIGVIQIVLVTMATLYAIAAIPICILVLFILQRVYLRTSKQIRQLDLELKGTLQSKLSESYAGLVTIRAHGWQHILNLEIHEALNPSQESSYLLYMIQTWLRLVLNLMVMVLSVAVTGLVVGIGHSANASATGLALLNITTLGETLTNVVSSWTSLETSLGAIARLKSFCADTPRESEMAASTPVAPKWPDRGDLHFDNVGASYAIAQNSDKGTWQLQDISFHVEAGERVAICGRTGSGKSTLLLALLGLVDICQGTVHIDDMDISRISPEILRSRVHVISQDLVLLGGTVQEYLDPESQRTTEEINEILDACGLSGRVHDLGGLTGELELSSVSAGELQLLSLARAVLQVGSRQGGIVLLDEATSNTDVDTERRIERLMKEKFRSKTVVAVLHRLEAALDYDRILVLNEGKMLHFDRPDVILRDAELFASLRISRFLTDSSSSTGS